jgi:uncharacterized membrane protein YraQ (UPF0718 family)
MMKQDRNSQGYRRSRAHERKKWKISDDWRLVWAYLLLGIAILGAIFITEWLIESKII